MDFLFWLALGVGSLFMLLSLLILVLMLLLEARKPAADRSWFEVLRNYWNDTGSAVMLGYLFIGAALLLSNPEKWFGLVVAPFALVAALGCLMILISDRAAAKEEMCQADKECWQEVSKRWGRMVSTCTSIAIAISIFFWITQVNNKLDEMGGKIKTLEEKAAGMGTKP